MLTSLKHAIGSTSFGRASLFRLEEIDKEVVVLSLTNMYKWSLRGVLAVLVLVSRHEPTFASILTEVVARKLGGVMDFGVAPIVGGIVQVRRGVRQGKDSPVHSSRWRKNSLPPRPQSGHGSPHALASHSGVAGLGSRSLSPSSDAAASGIGEDPGRPCATALMSSAPAPSEMTGAPPGQ
eukprot:TRINITY_DN16332_c0_g1_i1.p2 TRINITY_DN16332_c0_g1~~TRINITY_DN16332_c0_g1_i1.p2  ORF type:complete len:180 (-),score=16.46 TRINITY_DN16332_c0_g1_i1:723-1262(-)